MIVSDPEVTKDKSKPAKKGMNYIIILMQRLVCYSYHVITAFCLMVMCVSNLNMFFMHHVEPEAPKEAKPAPEKKGTLLFNHLS